MCVDLASSRGGIFGRGQDGGGKAGGVGTNWPCGSRLKCPEARLTCRAVIERRWRFLGCFEGDFPVGWSEGDP